MKVYIQSVLAMMVMFIFVSCGGGGGSGSSTGGGTGSVPDASVTSASFGSIEGFGSIFVNGIEFETEGAEVEIENEASVPCSPSATDDCGLREGMMVLLENAFDDNGNPTTVTKIKYADDLEGPISALTQDASGLVKTLTVLGQTVVLQKDVTRFDDSDPGFDDFDDLNAGNVNNLVEVSGTINFDGSIMATYIERKALAPIPGGLFEIKGTVSNLDPVLNTFDINGLTVDYAGVTPRDGTLGDGVMVEVKGDTFDGTTLFATDVEIQTAGIGLDDVAKVHVEGYVADLNSTAQTFLTNGQAIRYNGAVFVGGIASELADGVKVEAEGPIVNGVLQAVKIKFKDSVRFEANLATVNTGAGTLTLQGLAGITIQTDGLTFFDGFAGLNDLAPGNNLKIRGRRQSPAGNAVVATQIELIAATPDSRTIIQGQVDSFVAFSAVTILGVVVDTTSIDENDFKDDDTPIGETAFYGRLDVGDLVKARFDIDEGRWDQIEFQD